ncbi:MAG: 5'-deoxynucleotidase [Clostridia bacterium]|nr:5'-deoxynucleotidase [Clostridia bacterium]
MNYNFFAYLNRMKFIERWSLMHSTIKENIMEHSEQVAQISHILGVINNVVFGGNANPGDCVKLAVFHDANEVITGDLPTPVKYFNVEIRTAYKSLESVANDKLISMLPEELRGVYKKILDPDKNSIEYKLVSAADKISAYIKCLDELKSGNKEFLKAKKTIKQKIDDITLPEVQYFMDNFIKGFELSLDEME